MGYRSKPNQYRPRPPKGPVKLAFGLIADKNAPPPPPVIPFVPEPFARQDVVGTLDLKNIDYKSTPPLAKGTIERIKLNLGKIYEAGKFTNLRSVFDIVGNELLVSFPFDQSVIDRIKGMDRNERAWDPDQKLWRIFVGSFDDVFDIVGRGFKLTDSAYQAILAFIDSSYYAYVANGKFGKLIIRESWFEQIELNSDVPLAPALLGSNAYLKMIHDTVDPVLAKCRALIGGFNFKRKPYEHQIKGIEYLLANPEAALLDEMGCGKSFQIASAVALLMQQKTIDRALIVAPMSLLKTWQDELSMATDEPYTVIYGTPVQRMKTLASPAKIFLIHYEGLRLEEAKLSEWLKAGKGVLIFDESQRIKNLGAQTTMAALKLRPNVQRCIIATGTPIANRPLDLFSQYQVMDKGQTFGVKYSAFKNTFCDIEIQKIQVGRKIIRVEKFMGVRNTDELRDRIFRTSLRRLKSEVLDLPPVIYKDFMLELKGEQRQMYMQMRDNLKLEISMMTDSDIKSEASTIMVKLLRLSQISSNPKMLVPDYKGPNAKLTELEDLLDDTLADPTKKVILWSHFVINVTQMLSHFREKYGAVAHTGDMSMEDRQASVKAFQDDVTQRLFIATPQSAKEGLTLLPRDGVMVADTMVYLDLSFDSASYVQSQARFHRIGQTAERCLVVHLVGESTVDEYIRNTIVEKIKTATLLLDEHSIQSYSADIAAGTFSKDDLMNIL